MKNIICAKGMYSLEEVTEEMSRTRVYELDYRYCNLGIETILIRAHSENEARKIAAEILKISPSDFRCEVTCGYAFKANNDGIDGKYLPKSKSKGDAK